MKKEDKVQVIETISAQLQQYPHFYITDIAGLNAEETTKLRRECFEKGIKLSVVKNTLFTHVLKASGNSELESLIETLVGNTAIMYTTNANAPAKLIKEWNKKSEKPALKGAYVQECAFIGADKLDELVAVKSKEELLGDIIALLQSPVQRVLGALQSGGQTIAGVVKTLEEKNQ